METRFRRTGASHGSACEDPRCVASVGDGIETALERACSFEVSNGFRTTAMAKPRPSSVSSSRSQTKAPCCQQSSQLIARN